MAQALHQGECCSFDTRYHLGSAVGHARWIVFSGKHVDSNLRRVDARDGFREVVIGSGDKIFASSVRRLRKEGRTVHLVIARPSKLGAELELAANGCIWVLPTGECLRHRALAGAYGLAA